MKCKRMAAAALCAAWLAGLIPAGAGDAGARPAPPEAVARLCRAKYPEHAVASASGWGGDQAGQWALALSRQGEHVLVIAEKGRDEPAYRLTVENPAAFLPGDSRPQAMIDTGGDSVFVSSRDQAYFWSFHAVREDGRWGGVDLALYAVRQDGDTLSEHGLRVEDGLLYFETRHTDREGNLREPPCTYPPLPVPQLKGRTGLGVYDWRLFPTAPWQLLDMRARPRPDTLNALTPEGWTPEAVDMNPGGIYLLGRDAHGRKRLLIRRRENGAYADSVSRPLPDGAWMSAQTDGLDVYLYLSPDGPGFTFRYHEPDGAPGYWRLAYVMGRDWYTVAPGYLRRQDGPDDRFHIGCVPWRSVETVDLQRVPVTFEGALRQLDRSGWAVVNNPDPRDRLHLREAPRADAASLGKFYNGTPVKVLARRGAWAQVALGRLRGWMKAGFLAFGADMDGVAPAFPELTGTDDTEGRAMPVYARPDGHAPVVCRRDVCAGGTYWVAGVYGGDWVYVYFFEEDLGGYMKRAWFWEGSG